MSDPFSDIDQEVTLEKAKNLFFKYKKIIIITLSIFILAIGIILYTNNTKNNRDLRLSGYLVEIVSIINDDEDKAIRELEKLSRLGHHGHEILSNLLLSKIYLKRQNFSKAVSHLESIEIKDKELKGLEKLKYYFISVAYLGMNKKEDFEKNINKLLAYGDYWALLGHELRGHYLYEEGSLEAANKDFNKILNEQLSTASLRMRAQEMINNIKLSYEENN